MKDDCKNAEKEIRIAVERDNERKKTKSDI